MKLFYFSGNNEISKTQVLDIIEAHAPENSISIHTTIESFSEHLRQFHSEPVMAVIFLATKAELMNILFLKDLLTNIPLILILPDREKETISKGTLLHPRFISFIQNDFNELESVIKKMIDRYCS